MGHFQTEEDQQYVGDTCFTFLEEAKVRTAGAPQFPKTVLLDESLTSEQKQEIWDSLEKYKEIFVADPFKLGCTSLYEHHIDTGEARPIYIAPYRYSQLEHEVIEAEVKKMLELGIIQPSISSWSASVVIVRKPIGLGECALTTGN